MTSATPPPERRMFAIGLRVMATIMFATMMVFVKLLSDKGVKLPEILFWRQFLGLPVILAWVMMGEGLISLKTDRLPDHAKRAAMGSLGMFFNLGSVTLLPLAEATTFTFAVPLFATMLSALLLKERVGLQRWSAVFVGFIGILLVVRPGANTLPLFGSSIALCAALILSLVSVQLRDLGRTENSATMAFWFGAFATPVLALLLPFYWTPHVGIHWLLFIAMGLTGGCGQLFLNASFRFAPVAVVSGIDYISLIWATLFGWLIWDHLPPPSTWTGAPIVIGAALFIAWREHRLSVARRRELSV